MRENKKTAVRRKEPTRPTTLVTATGKAPPGHGCRRLGDAVIGLAGNVMRHFPFGLTLVAIVTSGSVDAQPRVIIGAPPGAQW